MGESNMAILLPPDGPHVPQKKSTGECEIYEAHPCTAWWRLTLK